MIANLPFCFFKDLAIPNRRVEPFMDSPSKYRQGKKPQVQSASCFSLNIIYLPMASDEVPSPWTVFAQNLRGLFSFPRQGSSKSPDMAGSHRKWFLVLGRRIVWLPEIYQVLQGIEKRGKKQQGEPEWLVLLLTIHMKHRLGLRVRNVKILPEGEEAVGGGAGSWELVILLGKENKMIHERGLQGSFSPKENKVSTLTSEGDLGCIGLDLLS